MNNCTACEYVGSCPYRAEGSCGGRTEKLEQQALNYSTQPVDMRAVVEALGFDPTNHHNAAKCPYCRPAEAAQQPARAGAVELSDEQIDAAVRAWFSEKPGSFQVRMRRAIAAATTAATGGKGE